MAMIPENWANSIAVGLREAFFTGYKEKPKQYDQVFRVQGSTKPTEKDLAVAGLKQWGSRPDGEMLTLDQMEEVGTVEYTHGTYRHGMTVTKALLEDDQYNTVSQWATELGWGAREKVETDSAAVFNNAVSGGQAGPDGSQLAANAHALARSSSTCDNYYAIAPSAANLQTAITDKKANCLDDAGKKIDCNPNVILAPPDLDFSLREIVGSVQKAGTGNNDINVLKDALKVVSWAYLTDTNRWFLIDTSLARLNFFWYVRPEFGKEENLGTSAALYAGRMRYSCGFSDWRGIAVCEAS